MDRRDLASEDEEEYDSAEEEEEEGSFTQSEDEAEESATAPGHKDLKHDQSSREEQAVALTEERGPVEEAENELEAAPAGADEDEDLEGALESVEEGMQTLNVDNEVISQGGEEDPEDAQVMQQPDAEDEQAAEQQQKKQPQPYDVPTKGKFWLHDDRYGAGESRRGRGRQKKIWDPTDDPWKHDMYEQLEAGRQDRYQEPRRGSDRPRGGRGRSRGGRRDFSRAGNFRAESFAAKSVAQQADLDDDAPPGYEQPRYKQTAANGISSQRDSSAAAAGPGPSRGTGWWESGPADEPADRPTGGRGRNRGRGRGQSLNAGAALAAAGGGGHTSSQISSSGSFLQGTDRPRQIPSLLEPPVPSLSQQAFSNTVPSSAVNQQAAEIAAAISQSTLPSSSMQNGSKADEPPRPPSTNTSRALNAAAQNYKPSANSPAPTAASSTNAYLQSQAPTNGIEQPPLRQQQGPNSSNPAAAQAPQMVFLQAPGNAQQGMQYQYIMPMGSSGMSQSGAPGSTWVQMPGNAPMGAGFQMVPAEVFGSGAQQAFIPGPMMMGTGYPLGMRPAMVKPVRRPITIQAPPDSQAAAGAEQALNAAPSNAPVKTGGRRYSAMTGRLTEDASSSRVS